MNDSMKATICCCAVLAEKLSKGKNSNPEKVSDQFIKNVQISCGLTDAGIERNKTIVKVAERLAIHGKSSKALSEAGL